MNSSENRNNQRKKYYAIYRDGRISTRSELRRYFKRDRDVLRDVVALVHCYRHEAPAYARSICGY